MAPTILGDPMPRKRPAVSSTDRPAVPPWRGPVGRMSSSDVKNRFGEAVAETERRGVVVVTRHDRPQVVLVSVEVYEALAGTPLVDLGALETAFTDRVALMQSPAQRRAVDALFASGGQPEQR